MSLPVGTLLSHADVHQGKRFYQLPPIIHLPQGLDGLIKDGSFVIHPR